MSSKNVKKIVVLALTMALTVCIITACGTKTSSSTHATSTKSEKTYKKINNSKSGGHAILVNGKTKTYNYVSVTKTGGSNSQDADFYGTNAAILAKNGGTLTLKNSIVKTSGKHANAVFAYGSKTTVNVSDTKITTTKDNSGGIMTTGGATMNATNLKVNTSGNSSAAIRSDRGGGNVKVTKGTYKTTGVGSPVIYSTAKIKVNNAKLTSSKSEAVVIEGSNSVNLKDCTVNGNNTKKNGQAKYLDNVLIYQSMSGDASSGASSFTMNGGTMTSKSGAMFHVTNTTCTINLTNTTLNLDNSLLLTESADNWGTSGSNGGHATLNATKQTLAGTIKIGSSSSLKLNLKDDSTYSGKINSSAQKGTVKVTVGSGCTWKLTGNSHVSSLSVSKSGKIDTNGHKLYVNGKLYKG